MTSAPWEHQRKAAALIAERPSIMLAHEMGTGKTRSALDGLAEADARKIIVLCPKSIIGVWIRQAGEYHPARWNVLPLARGSTRQRGDQLRTMPDGPTIVIVNYDAAWRGELGAALSGQTWDALVLDESHRIKAPNGRASRWVRGKLAPRCVRRIALTGTPMPHSPLDLWAQADALGPGKHLDRSFFAFRHRYAVMGGHRVNGRAVQVVGWKSLPDLYHRMAAFADVVRKADVLDLPPILHETIPIRITGAARRVYDALERDMTARVSTGEVTASNVLVQILRLAELTSGYARTSDGMIDRLHSEKADALADILADSSGPVVVFCRFVVDLSAARAAAESNGWSVDELSGRRNDIGAVWEPRLPRTLAVVQIQSGGLGIDLTAASVAVYWSQTWSLGDYDQSMARLHRPGQRGASVLFLHLVVEDSIDETMRAALSRRADLVESIIGRFQHDHRCPVA
jgi:SNF2 family DNA or RNA helicase